MPKAITKKQVIGTGILLLLVVSALLWFWSYSPLHRAIAWYQLRMGNYESMAEGKRYAQTLLASSTANLSDVSNYLLTTSERIDSSVATPLDFTTTNAEDPLFIAGSSYRYPIGKQGTYDLQHKTLLIEGRDVDQVIVAGKTIIPVVNETIFTGTKDIPTLTKALQTAWATVVTALPKKDAKTLQTLATPEDYYRASLAFNLSDLSYRLQAKATIDLTTTNETDTAIQVGTLFLKESNCSVTATVLIVYEKDTHTYRFGNVYPALASLCAKPKAKPTSGTLTCKNCWLAPVSKQYVLPANYAPTVVATGLNGGGAVTPDTKKELTALFTDAKAKGVTKIRVSSSYRSFKVQTDLFNSYVHDEEKAGLSYSQAVTKANTYSALPGHSEHQLGTTLDLMACSYPCTFDNPGNTVLYTYLLANAYKFGFIISYPNGSEPYTGYVYEPWHVRYIGVTLATELYNRGYLKNKGFYLYQFLLEKGKY